MLVSDLKPSLDSLREASQQVNFGDISVDEEFSTLTVGGREFQLDEYLERSIARYLGVSKTYLAKCPPDLKATNINHWLQAKPHLGAVVHTVNDEFASLTSPGKVVLPVREVAGVIGRAFDPTFEVTNMVRSDTMFMVDVKTDHQIEVPPNEDIPDRVQGDRAIGDITHGAVRVLANPTEVTEPSVQRMLYRLWCLNGATSPEAAGEIKLKGRDIDTILEEMEQACQLAMSRLDRDLESYAALANKYPPGSKEAFARQVGGEYKIPARVMTRVLDRIEILPASATLYDIMQVFTQEANGNVPYATKVKLQGLGGDLAMDTEHVINRCNTCERLLPA